MTGRIIATDYVSLDGVIEDPVGMENSGLGDWTGPFNRGPEGDRFKLVLGRGKRLFPEHTQTMMKLVQCGQFDDGNVLLRYEAA